MAMAKQYGKRLANLRVRRQAPRGATVLAADSAAERFYATESYEKRSSGEATKYTLGSMQEVNSEYTKIGIDEANRVGDQLHSGLKAEGISISLDLQGSVPLNIHIRGASDVDVLALHDGFITKDSSGVRAQAGHYTSLPGSVFDDMRALRSRSEIILQRVFWGATVDTSGAKSIKLSDGSLKRKIDVVPAHWHDTATYQISQQKHDREVRVWDKVAQTTIPNLPFLHMKKINDKDVFADGGLKKTIRLLKNIRKDAEEDGPTIALSSFDLASLMWHCHDSILRYPSWQELSLLNTVDSHLETLASSYALAASLNAPDGSRKIVDTPEKFNSLVRLSAEVHAIALDVLRESNYLFGLLSEINRETLRKGLLDARVSAA